VAAGGGSHGRSSSSALLSRGVHRGGNRRALWRSSLPHQEKFSAEARIMRSAHFVSEVQPITGGAYTAEEIISSKTGQHCCFAA